MSGPSAIISLGIKIIPLAFILSASTTIPVQRDDIKGIWVTTDSEAIVEVYKKNELYYGRVRWLSKPNDKHGNPKRDHRNKDPHLKNRPLLGMNTLYNLKFDAGKQQWEGKVYVPLVGLEVRAVVNLKDKNTMRIRGYYGGMRKTQIWTRVKKSKGAIS